MALRKRQTLKNYFQSGSLPMEENFHDLIDSTLNTVDDGFSKSSESGFTIASLGKHDGLLGFSRDSNPRHIIWSVSYSDRNELRFGNPDSGKTALTLSANAVDESDSVNTLDAAAGRVRVGVNTETPGHTLDVAGTIRSHGRIGSDLDGENSVPADGRWQDVTESLDGCHALEIMAGAADPTKARYALMRAFAQNTFNPSGWFFNFLNLKRRIRYDHACYRSLADRIRLRWTGDEHDYRLQIKTRTNYGAGAVIRYYVTRLWFDTYMAECKAPLPDRSDEQ